MIPESADSTFTWELFQVKVNKELADTFGNFVNRILKFAVTHFDSSVPEGGIAGEREKELENTCTQLVNKYCDCLNNLEFRKAIDTLYSLWILGNQYIDDKVPWKLIKTNRDEAAQVIRTCINLIRVYAIVQAPILPFTSTKLFDALHLPDTDRITKISESVNFEVLQPGNKFDLIPPLFRKLEDEEIKALSIKFGS